MAQAAIRGQGIPFSIYSQKNQFVSIPAGSVYTFTAGTYMLGLGLYTSLEVLDPITNTWRVVGTAPGQLHYVNSDGANYRLVNRTGTPTGASITNQGSGYTNGIFLAGISTTTGLSGITVAASSGGSTWAAIVGGTINTTVTITAAGSGYTYPPQLVISAPPSGGLQATATCTISGGAINAVTVTNQGAGYVTAPTITVINDYRDTVGSGGVLTVNSTLTNSGALTGLYPIDPGTALTSVPTLSFSGGGGASAAATAIMNFSVTGYTVGTAGAVYTGTPYITADNLLIAAQSAPVNPAHTNKLAIPRPPRITGATSSGAVTATGAVVEDGGWGIQVVPTAAIINTGSIPTTAAVITLTVGGTTDTVFIEPI
jgi:hypothetical protein